MSRCCLTNMGIPIIKIIRSHDRLFFVLEIPIHEETVLILIQIPWPLLTEYLGSRRDWLKTKLWRNPWFKIRKDSWYIAIIYCWKNFLCGVWGGGGYYHKKWQLTTGQPNPHISLNHMFSVHFGCYWPDGDPQEDHTSTGYGHPIDPHALRYCWPLRIINNCGWTEQIIPQPKDFPEGRVP